MSKIVKGISVVIFSLFLLIFTYSILFASAYGPIDWAILKYPLGGSILYLLGIVMYVGFNKPIVFIAINLSYLLLFFGLFLVLDDFNFQVMTYPLFMVIINFVLPTVDWIKNK